MTLRNETVEDRELTSEEKLLVTWLLECGGYQDTEYLSQLDKARVVARCGCGCASIDFAIDGVVPKRGEPMSILSDYEWTDSEGRLFGAFVFSRCGLLSGLEVWSQDGLAIPTTLQKTGQLRPIGTGKPP